MRRRLAAPLSLIVLSTGLLLWLVAVPLVSAGDPCYHGFTMPSETTGSDPEIKLEPCAFSPTVTKVDVGASVKFVNGGEFTHLITGANQAWGSRDVEIQPGKTASYTSTRPASTRTPAPCTAGCRASSSSATGRRRRPQARVRARRAGRPPRDRRVGARRRDPGNAGDGRLLLVAAFGGAVLGGLVAWAAMRRSRRAAKETVSGVA